jgi:hypothetical protein
MWLVGIDEAGYGPNLGPLVMTSVACRLPNVGRGKRNEGRAAPSQPDLWKILAKAVRKPPEADDGRLPVADSKLVYSPARGLVDLEKGVLGTVARGDGRDASDRAPRDSPLAPQLRDYIDWACPDAHAELRGETWFTGTTTLPVAAASADIDAARAHFEKTCARRGVVWGLIRSVVICPARFNSLVDRWGTKGAVLGLGLTELLRCNQAPDDDNDPVCFVVDKHGGRNHYSALVQHALDGGMVLAQAEGANRSIYQVVGLRRPVQVTFEPRADAGHFCVALASMLSKYLREVLMLEFNRFWQGHVPGLKATAGYPGDAERFYQAIRPAACRLGLDAHTLWRQR